MEPKRKSAFAIRRTASSEGVWTPLPVLLRLHASHLLAALTYEEIEKNVVKGMSYFVKIKLSKRIKSTLRLAHFAIPGP